MEVLHFNTSVKDGKKAFKDLTTDPKYTINHIHTTYADPHMHSSVYFTLADELTDTELDQLQAAKITASVIAQDEKYLTLKNNIERELFLLNGFGINSDQAVKVMALAAMLIRGNLPQQGSVK